MYTSTLYTHLHVHDVFFFPGHSSGGSAQHRRAASLRERVGGADGAIHVPRHGWLWATCGDHEDEERCQGAQRHAQGAYHIYIYIAYGISS